VIERTNRWMKYRDKSLNQELLYLRSINDQAKVKEISQKIALHREKAAGLSLTVNNNMPGWTDLITNAFNAEGTYRLFSAIAHNQHWALIVSGFRVSETGIIIFENVSGSLLQKNIPASAILFVFLLSIMYFSKMLRVQFTLFGWDQTRFNSLEKEVVKRIKEISDKYDLIN